MDYPAAAELKTALVGVSLPATKPDLLAYAVEQRVEPTLLDALRTLREGHEYIALDEVVEELVHVQPSRERPVPHKPKEESGKPPGGDSYTELHPQPGAVRESSRVAGT